MRIVAYSGGLFLKQDFSFEEYDRYEAISEDTKFDLFLLELEKRNYVIQLMVQIEFLYLLSCLKNIIFLLTILRKFFID